MSGDDYRIQIGGEASIVGSQIASGRNVHQIRNDAERSDDVSKIEQAIDRVAELLERHRDQIPESHRARRDLEDIRQEVAEAEPDRDRISHALQRLGARVTAVAVVAQAVADLSALVTGM
mgnify:CR=1 FL=1